MDLTNQILELLYAHKTMSNRQLCDELFCSPSSLRRDLIRLEQTGSVRRIRSGHLGSNSSSLMGKRAGNLVGRFSAELAILSCLFES